MACFAVLQGPKRESDSVSSFSRFLEKFSGEKNMLHNHKQVIKSATDKDKGLFSLSFFFFFFLSIQNMV